MLSSTNNNSEDFNRFCNIGGASQKVARKKIKTAKLKISEVIKEALKIQDLKPMEQDYINQILARNMADRIGKYTERYNTIIGDYFIICGILYNHQPHHEHRRNAANDISDEELENLLDDFTFELKQKGFKSQ